jgi:phage shock protein PspC (stress-responsive transcriptional regulator)
MAKKKGQKRKPAGSIAHRRVEEKHSLEKGVEYFGEEMEVLGERLENKGKVCQSWFHSTFGVVGPLLSSVVGLVILTLVIWVLTVVNIPVGSGLLNNIQYFFLASMGLFFLIFLFFSYSSYFSKVSPKAYMPFSPIITAIGIIIGFWFAVNAIKIANLSMGITWLSNIANWIEDKLFWIFWVLLIMGYLFLLLKISAGRHICSICEGADRKSITPVPKRPAKGGIHRLYRSGNDRILGGVCGGMAEYIGIDPTVVRLLWVLIALAWGVGILAYIILWIIVPRNPDHKWD